MSGEYEQIPESFIRGLEAERREFVQFNEKSKIIDLDQLSDTVYPDTAHLLFELLQNAEDAGATSARFKLSETKLDFAHDGRPFTREDVKSILSYFRGTKAEKQDNIGRFGIGFKSVFACTETPRIFSDTVAFEIVDRIVPRAIPRPASSIHLSNRETVIELPFNGEKKTPDKVREEIRLGLARMSAMSILHLKNIKSIEWTREGGDSGWINRTELADRVVQVDIKRPSGEDRCCFLRFREPYTQGSSMHLDVVFKLKEKEGEQGTLRLDSDALGDCFRIVPARRGSVAVFFPAEKETSNLRFHLHAPFIPELSRASIKEHSDNADLFARLAELAAKSLSTIRDLGLLDREFLGVLPNSHDSLPEAYKPFHEAIVQEMREKPLVPMQNGGHGRATGLLQGRAESKAFLGVRDIQFLMSGWDYDSYYDTDHWSPRTDRSTQPSLNYQGWAVSPTQRNTAVDRLLTDLTIDAFKDQNLAPPDSKKEEEIEEWLATHDVVWHRAYYSSLSRVEQKCRGTYLRLQGLPIVRASSGEYRPAVECRFASDEEAPEGVTIADPDIYSSGKGAQRAKHALERLGVREIDDESRAFGILGAYYDEGGKRPTWAKHRSHIESFIELLKSGSVMAGKFRKYSLLLDSDKDWKPPANLYAGNEYAESSAGPYYRSLQRLSYAEQNLHQCSVRHELYRRYRNIPGFSEFARRIGVVCQIPILETSCQRNSQYEHLSSRGGKRWNYYTGIDRDWYVPCLDRMLERLKKAQDHDSEREALATAIWSTLCETKEDKLEASFQLNRSADLRCAPSQLVCTLRSYAWVPQRPRGDGLVFVTPREARREWLPKGFVFDLGWAWVKATEFGQERTRAQETLNQETNVRDREAKAKELGFENLGAVEEGKWYALLPESERIQIRQWHALKRRQPPDIREPGNPERRRKRAKEQAEEAPIRKSEPRKRSIVDGEARLKEEARTSLRANYEEHAHISLCQVIGCQDRSFKLKEGTWYFEAVRFLGLDRMVAVDYVALCPRHAAMYQHAKESAGLKQEFEESCSAGNHGKVIAMPVVLAGENVEILLAPKHAIDLEAALNVDRERDSESD